MLNLIFGPAMAIMSRLRFALKLGLIGALFMVPLAAVVYFLNGEIAANISSLFRRANYSRRCKSIAEPASSP
jgi:hypothetical protein